MLYNDDKVMQAFRIYTQLAMTGSAEKEVQKAYMVDDQVRGLVDQFAAEVDCTVIATGEQLFLIPLVRLSPFHFSNDYMKKTYLRAAAVNADLYLMYVTIMVFIGAFYDSYQSLEPTRNFIPLDEWAAIVQERIDSLREHDEEKLKLYEKEFSYNWSAVIEKWDTMDDIKETAKRQSGNTISRLSFLDTVKRFLVEQQVAEEVGSGEIGLTEKTKVIVQRYFMELEYNRGILQFLYDMDGSKKMSEEARDYARNIKN
ncbi:hypothetical protein PaecuDRAFT_3942 [Paenibacillus curdlanolyticus YK9]|uniref:Non-ribosomal peptide synthetase module n=1 Tax=Paenibacillus curdlanolyticus YK9 TaxID=717606 RepID=E0IE51_9BACL|nr:DUF6063 family protein [Paenibacillus curdlanolyticus]EFM09405.1 hypothetical protein PaecuDRAFT_3942 [Paenibacillus curdlanolyticus YK9]